MTWSLNSNLGVQLTLAKKKTIEMVVVLLSVMCSRLFNFSDRMIFGLTCSLTNINLIMLMLLIHFSVFFQGSFRTIEMKPQRPGWWLLDTEVAEYQQAGMQASYLVIEKGTELRCFVAGGVKL